MKNALSIDLEDWFCANNLQIPVEDWGSQELRIVPNTHRILDLLDRHKTRATWFVLGWFAERAPELVREIRDRGHEIATHGYAHKLLTEMTPEEFEGDLCRGLEVTERCIRERVSGFRAPSFTVTGKTLWALDILAKHGLKYDSSIFPINYHPDYGIPDAPLAIHRRGEIWEVPLAVVRLLGKNIPCGGGGYFRMVPYLVTRFLMGRCNQEKRPVVFYFHPWEIDLGQPRRALSRSKRLRHYRNLEKTLPRLERLLTDFEFAPICELLKIEKGEV